MIRLIQSGDYRLIETKGQTKILILDEGNIFAWVNAEEIGEILVTSHKSHAIDHILAIGYYRMYEVKNELKFVDLTHLELYVGDGTWQGYLLPTGLPTDKKRRNRIIPTKETITNSKLDALSHFLY